MDGKRSTLRIEVLDLTNETIRMRTNNMPMHWANAIRRALLTEVPILAVSRVQITDNTTHRPDQPFSEELGLMPFVTDDAVKFSLQDNCSCLSKGKPYCTKCSIGFKLQMENPITEDNYSTCEPIQLTTDHLKPHTSNRSSKIKPLHPMPITLLEPGGRVDMDLILTKHVGREHARWSPGHVGLSTGAKVTLREDVLKTCTKEHRTELVKMCPRKVFSCSNMDDLEDIQVTNESQCSKCQNCERLAQRIGKPTLVQVQDISTEITMEACSSGRLEPLNWMRMAIQAIRNDLEQLI